MADVPSVATQPATMPPRLRPTLLTVRHLSPTRWSVVSCDCRRGGTFTTHKAALHYAREEAAVLPRAVLVVFRDDGLTISETYEAHERVKVSAIAAPGTRAA